MTCIELVRYLVRYQYVDLEHIYITDIDTGIICNGRVLSHCMSLKGLEVIKGNYISEDSIYYIIVDWRDKFLTVKQCLEHAAIPIKEVRFVFEEIDISIEDVYKIPAAFYNFKVLSYSFTSNILTMYVSMR